MPVAELAEAANRMIEHPALSAPDMAAIERRVATRRRRRRVAFGGALAALGVAGVGALSLRDSSSVPVTATASTPSLAAQADDAPVVADEGPAVEGEAEGFAWSGSGVDISVSRTPFSQERADEIAAAAETTIDLSSGTAYIARSDDRITVSLVTPDAIVVFEGPTQLVPEGEGLSEFLAGLGDGGPMVFGPGLLGEPPSDLRPWLEDVLPVPDELRDLLERRGDLSDLFERLPDFGERFGDFEQWFGDPEGGFTFLPPSFGPGALLGWEVSVLPDGYSHAGGGIDIDRFAGRGLTATCEFSNDDGDRLVVAASSPRDAATALEEGWGAGDSVEVRGTDGRHIEEDGTRSLAWVEDGVVLSIEGPSDLSLARLLDVADGLVKPIASDWPFGFSFGFEDDEADATRANGRFGGRSA